MAKYILAVSIMMCAALVGIAATQEPAAPQPKPQEKTTQQPQDKAPQAKSAEKAPQPMPAEKAPQPMPAEKAPQPMPAEKTPQPKTDQENPKPVLAQAAGDIVSIDAMKNELVIKDNAGVETHILITPSTTITKGGKTITLADIKAGDKITSECEDTADGFKARTITVTTPAPSQ